jgi:hypothetical protein
MDKEIKQLIEDGGIIWADFPSWKKELLEDISNKGYSDKFVEIINNGKYSIEDILNQYAKDARHLEFMAGDVNELVLEKSDDAEYVQFAIENYEINTLWIQSQLLGGDFLNSGSASLMVFNSIINPDHEPEDYEIIMSGESSQSDSL